MDVVTLNAAKNYTDSVAGGGVDYIPIADATTITQELVPNVFYKFLTLTTCTALTLTLGAGSPTELNTYWGKFTTGATPPTFTAIAGVVWDANNIDPTTDLVANKTYEFSIVDGLGTVKEW